MVTTLKVTLDHQRLTYLLRKELTTTIVMVLKGNTEILAFVDLRDCLDTEEIQVLLDYQGLKDQQAIMVQLVSLEELVLVANRDQRVMQDGVGHPEMLVPLDHLDHLAVSVTT